MKTEDWTVCNRNVQKSISKSLSFQTSNLEYERGALFDHAVHYHEIYFSYAYISQAGINIVHNYIHEP